MTVRTVIIHPGDTLVTLATRHLDNASAWSLLAAVNALDYPYVTADPAPFLAAGLRVLGPGQPILVPGDGESLPSTLTSAEQRAYGIDLGWEDADLEVLMEGDRPGIDRGLINLVKALYRRLITKPGELPAHPEYGCRAHQHLGHPASEWRARLAALDVRAAILQDPRVQAVTASAEHTPDGALRVTALVTPVPPSETTITLAMTYAGGTASGTASL